MRQLTVGFLICSHTRSSATTERQCVSCTRLSELTQWSCTSLNTAPVVYNYTKWSHTSRYLRDNAA